MPQKAEDTLARGAPPLHRFHSRDRRRLVLWGAAAAAAVLGAALASLTAPGHARLDQALDHLRGHAAAEAMNQRDLDEVRRLAFAVHALGADREQLAARLSGLERSLQDITGSVARPSKTTPTVQGQPTAAAVTPDLVFKPADPAATSIGPEVTATVEYGVDIGGAMSVERLRMQWTAVKARHARALGDLRPAMTVREFGRPRRTELRLLVGPLADASTATRLCATLLATGVKCYPGNYEGYPLPW